MLRNATWLAACLPLASGCFGPSNEAIARLDAVKAEAILQQMGWDALEERLLWNQSRVLLWKELQSRHHEVSAIACQNAVTHAVAMQQHAAREEARTQPPHRRNPVLAQTQATEPAPF